MGTNIILFAVIITVLLIDKFLSKTIYNRNNTLLIGSVQKKETRSKKRKKYIILIGSSILLIILKIIFNDEIQNLSVFYFQYNFNELLVFLVLFIFYNIFSVKTVINKIKKNKIIAREILYLNFNIILAIVLAYFAYDISDRNIEYLSSSNQFVEQTKKYWDIDLITQEKTPDSIRIKAENLGFVVYDYNVYKSRWFDIIPSISNNTFNGENNYRDKVYHLTESSLSRLRNLNPEMFNDFLDFFGPLNQFSLDGLVSVDNDFTFNGKKVNIISSNFDSRNFTNEFTIGSFNVDEISSSSATRRRLKLYRHNYYKISPTNNSKIPDRYYDTGSGRLLTKSQTAITGWLYDSHYTKHYTHDGHLTSDSRPNLSSKNSEYDPKFAGIYAWHKKYQKWVPWWRLNEQINAFNSEYGLRAGFWRRELDDLFYQSGGKKTKKIYLNNIDYRICDYYDCTSNTSLNEYEINLTYNFSEKERLLTLPITFLESNLDSLSIEFTEIKKYGVDNLYNVEKLSTLLWDDKLKEYYNKNNNIFKNSLLRKIEAEEFDSYVRSPHQYPFFIYLVSYFLIFIFIIAYVYRLFLASIVWAIYNFKE